MGSLPGWTCLADLPSTQSIADTASHFSDSKWKAAAPWMRMALFEVVPRFEVIEKKAEG
jgi:hypothetical protein